MPGSCCQDEMWVGKMHTGFRCPRLDIGKREDRSFVLLFLLVFFQVLFCDNLAISGGKEDGGQSAATIDPSSAFFKICRVPSETNYFEASHYKYNVILFVLSLA